MPRVVPSQIVELIRALKLETDRRAGLESAAQFGAVVTLVDQLSPDLLQLSASEYGLFVMALGDVRDKLARWRSGVYSNLTYLRDQSSET